MEAASRARSHSVPCKDESLSFAHSHHPLTYAALALSSASVFTASRAKAACARDERTNIPIDCSEVSASPQSKQLVTLIQQRALITDYQPEKRNNQPI